MATKTQDQKPGAVPPVSADTLAAEGDYPPLREDTPRLENGPAAHAAGSDVAVGSSVSAGVNDAAGSSCAGSDKVLIPPISAARRERRQGRPIRCEQAETPSFASGLNFYKLFWVFFIGSFLGVIIETVWCFATTLRLESRQGLIYGPFNALYGFGALAMTLGLYWLSNKRDIWVFGGGFVIGSIYEYFCSYFQESLFGTVSWQYDQFPLNLNGRINFLYSMFWGLLALLWVKELFPRLSHLIERIPSRVGRPLSWVLLGFMCVNIVLSSLAVARYNERHEGLAPANQVEQLLDQHYPDERMEKVYPNMVFVGSYQQ